jgi:MoxR-like ATPase
MALKFKRYMSMPGGLPPERDVPPPPPAELPASRLQELNRPQGYLADSGLEDAVNVALLLARPLLLSGEPGTGKTQLAYSLAWQLGLGTPLKFETKSTSVAADLFYYYNSLAFFHAAQAGEKNRRPENYITFNALGRAILLASKQPEVSDLRALLTRGPGGEAGSAPSSSPSLPPRSVVLIDEIDKAPRDFPNDVLNEVEGMYFKVPELENREVRASPDHQPVLVITSNSEKNLPDPFLRRCVYYNIPFPKGESLEKIVVSRLGTFAPPSDQFLKDALALFQRFRLPASGLRKKPSVPELLDWLRALRASDRPGDNPLAAPRDGARPALSFAMSSLIKEAGDRPLAEEVVNRWLKESTSPG